MILNIEPLRVLKFGQLPVQIYASNEELGQAAAQDAQAAMLRAIAERGEANVILATGNSQLSTLHALRQQADIPWSRVRFFHMDEYIGISAHHPARFSHFLHQHFFDHLSEAPAAFYPVPLLDNPYDARAFEATCREYETLLRQYPADVCLLGIGENGHLAFNDPPYAQFDDPAWVKVIQLAQESRQQQVNEGHFAAVEETPTHAITLTIPALLAAKRVLAIVPEARKIDAVYRTLYGPINEECPSSILRKTPHAHLFLDADSARQIQ